MGYASLCNPENVQFFSDPYFHSNSYDNIRNYTTTGLGKTAFIIGPAINTPPTVNAGADFTIPRETSFKLAAASASDANNDSLTYCWEEFDLGAGVWSIPAARMKASAPHVVPLSEPALALVRSLLPKGGKQPKNGPVFVSPRGKNYSDMALLKVVQTLNADSLAAGGAGWLDKDGARITPHGFRSSFRDWCGAAGTSPNTRASYSGSSARVMPPGCGIFIASRSLRKGLGSP